VKTRTEPRKVELEADDPQKPFKAIFAESDLPDNLSQAAETIDALETISSKQQKSRKTKAEGNPTYA